MYGAILSALGGLLSQIPSLSSVMPYGSGIGNLLQSASPYLSILGKGLETGGGIGSAIQSENAAKAIGTGGGAQPLIGGGTTTNRTGVGSDAAKLARESLATSKKEGQASGLVGASEDYYLEQAISQLAAQQGISFEEARKLLEGGGV